MKNVNKNFIYNVLYQLLLYIIPLILTPYISRILGPEKIGIYSYTYSIVYYFMLFTLLGINNYGSRSIARTSNNRNQLSKIFFSLYGLQLRIGLIMIVAYNLLIIFVYKEYIIISLIHNFFLLSAIFDINWFYFGIEKFKITITRNIIIKFLSLICVFLFVKSEDSLWIYTLIMSTSTLISQLYLFLFLKKYVDYQKSDLKESFTHLKSCLILFIPVLAYGIYRVMDKTMLGYLASTVELGFYENSEKIINIPVSFLTAMGTVMIPHMAKTKVISLEEINTKIMSSFELCFCFMIPMIFGLLGIANDFSIIYFGDEFEKCGIIISLLVPTILFGSIANVIRTNYLIPFEKDKIYVKSTVYGALINIIMNLLFIRSFGAIGACIGTISAEFLVMFYQVINVRKELDLKKMMKLLFKYLIKGLIMFVYIIVIGLIVNKVYLKLIIQVGGAIILYFLMCKDYILYDFLGKKKRTIHE